MQEIYELIHSKSYDEPDVRTRKWMLSTNKRNWRVGADLPNLGDITAKLVPKDILLEASSNVRCFSQVGIELRISSQPDCSTPKDHRLCALPAQDGGQCDVITAESIEPDSSVKTFSS
ncbi:hypothetical protein AXG93_3857s1080 [Marchantia polymorpha subsp. ruderalis]|uniref:Uncharacterized protein n=1 Tax=Marchantia polymorpha subsp. ruderalis TaxID=1480154 RepID=A0A176W397_MARPO|nr:hypothetical protein AXG93_3857s1080 [Marchantia polymorpha subsp. ruderalis]